MKKSRALSTSTEADENDNEEEEDFVDALEDGVPIPSPDPSPPHERKSQDTDDISGRNSRGESQDSGDTAPAHAVPDNAVPLDAQTQTVISSPTPAIMNAESQNQPDIVVVSATGEVDAKAPTGEQAAAASAEPAAVPPPAAVSAVTEEAEIPATTSANPVAQPETQRTHEIDDENQPHSHAARTSADSDTRETKRPTPPLSEVDGATKRPRDDEDGDLDPNPRETKRASPPPEKEKEKEKKERPVRKKSGSDAHAPSAPASPRPKSASVFVGRPLSSFS